LYSSFFLRLIAQLFTQIYMNCFVSSYVEQTGWILVNLCTIAEYHVKADMKKVYDNLIIINLYQKLIYSFWKYVKLILKEVNNCLVNNFWQIHIVCTKRVQGNILAKSGLIIALFRVSSPVFHHHSNIIKIIPINLWTTPIHEKKEGYKRKLKIRFLLFLVHIFLSIQYLVFSFYLLQYLDLSIWRLKGHR
jgi:hypothetical protein